MRPLTSIDTLAPHAHRVIARSRVRCPRWSAAALWSAWTLATGLASQVGTLQVRSENPASGVSVSLSLVDLNGARDGATAFDRRYGFGANVTLTVPMLHGLKPFKHWVLNGTAQGPGQNSVTVFVDTATETATAVYETHVPGTLRPYGTGCPGTGGRVPVHSVSGTPELGWQVRWHVDNALGFTAGTFLIGLSDATYLGLPLPIDLEPLGMGHACALLVSVDMDITFLTDANGQVTAITPPLPDDPALIGVEVFTQAAVFDLGAGTRTPFVMTNAVAMRIGGRL